MAYKVRAWYTVVNKIFALISIVLSVAVLVSTVYTLTKVSKTKLQSITPKLRTILIYCSAVSLGCAFIQCILSFRTLISCSKKFGVGMKLWLFVHFTAFLVYLTAIIVPLVYYEGQTGKILTAKNLKGMFSNEDILTTYFAFLVANSVFLLIFLLINCICHQCGHADKSEPDDQKQKLLATPGNNDLYKY